MAGPVYSALERAVLHRLAESTGRAVDLAYASIVHQLGITQRFFQEGGFGDLSLVDFHSDVKAFQAWPPAHFDTFNIDWRRTREGSYSGAGYTLYHGTFPTPVSSHVHDALPPESRIAHAQWIVPNSPAPENTTVIGLAATGDHGFARREHLMLPLVASGIGSMSLESPFYGMRKPPKQQGAKLRRVSDLLLLGRVTIEESLLLLHWLAQRGHSRLGISGLSMGGVHAAMVAALYPNPVALTMLLAPRSAASAYCRGALFHATDWDRLLRDREGRESEILAAIEAAAAANERMAAAKIRHEVLAAKQRVSTIHCADVAKEVTLVGHSMQQPNGRVASEQGTHPSPAVAGHWAAVGQWMGSWSAALQGQLHKVVRLERSGGVDRHAAAVAMMEAVLETFTDASRFPRPMRPDAAILVAATEDAYVSPQSVLEMHKHLPGSEIRWVPGGHVSSFLLHQPTFRAAIADSLSRL